MNVTRALSTDTSVGEGDAALHATSKVAPRQQAEAQAPPPPPPPPPPPSVAGLSEDAVSGLLQENASGATTSVGADDGGCTVTPDAAAAAPPIAEGGVPFATVFYSLDGAVVKYNVVLRIRDGGWLVVDRRYSDILSLHHILKKMYCDTERHPPTATLAPASPFPRFPGRGLIHASKGNNIKFLLRRRRALNEYFRALTATLPCGSNVYLLSSASRHLLIRFCTLAPVAASRDISSAAAAAAAAHDGEGKALPHAAPACFLDDGLELDAVFRAAKADAASRNALAAAAVAEMDVSEVAETSLTRVDSTVSRSSSSSSRTMGVSSHSGGMSFFSVPQRLCACQNTKWIKAAYGRIKPLPPLLPCMSAIPTLAFGLPHAKMYFDRAHPQRLQVVLRSEGHESLQEALWRRDELLAFYEVVAQKHGVDMLPSTPEARCFFSEYKRQRPDVVRRPLMTIKNLRGRLLLSGGAAASKVEAVAPPLPSSAASAVGTDAFAGSSPRDAVTRDGGSHNLCSGNGAATTPTFRADVQIPRTRDNVPPDVDAPRAADERQLEAVASPPHDMNDDSSNRSNVMDAADPRSGVPHAADFSAPLLQHVADGLTTSLDGPYDVEEALTGVSSSTASSPKRPHDKMGDPPSPAAAAAAITTASISSSTSIAAVTATAFMPPRKRRSRHVPLCSNSVHLLTHNGDASYVEAAPHCSCTMTAFCSRRGSPCDANVMNFHSSTDLATEKGGGGCVDDCSSSGPRCAPAQLCDMYKTACGYIIYVQPPTNE